MDSSNNKGFALAGALLLIVFLTVLMTLAISRTRIQLIESDQKVFSQSAFYAAEAGIEHAVAELRTNPTWRPGVGSLAEYVQDVLVDPVDPSTKIGQFTLRIANAPDFNGYQSVWAVSEGEDFIDDSVLPVRRVLQSRIIVVNPASFFISTLGDIHIASGSVFEGNILGRDVFFDINPSLDDDSPNKRIFVNGDVEFLRDIYLDEEDEEFVDIEGETKNAPSITFPGLDLDRYKQLATTNGTVYESDASLSIDDLAPPNGVVFVEGNLNISGSYTTSMLVVASGTIFIEGDVKQSGDSEDLPQIGLFAAQDVLIESDDLSSDELDIEAFVMADGVEGSRGGIFEATGIPFSKSELNFKGAISVRGRGVETAVNLNAFTERNYDYDQEFLNNPKIPFVTYLGNIVSWEEIFGDTYVFPPS